MQAEYKAAGGKDLGAVTDWNEAITRNAISYIQTFRFQEARATGPLILPR
jgi:hypothetical protein